MRRLVVRMHARRLNKRGHTCLPKLADWTCEFTGRCLAALGAEKGEVATGYATVTMEPWSPPARPVPRAVTRWNAGDDMVVYRATSPDAPTSQLAPPSRCCTLPKGHRPDDEPVVRLGGLGFWGRTSTEPMHRIGVGYFAILQLSEMGVSDPQ